MFPPKERNNIESDKSLVLRVFKVFKTCGANVKVANIAAKNPIYSNNMICVFLSMNIRNSMLNFLIND